MTSPIQISLEHAEVEEALRHLTALGRSLHTEAGKVAGKAAREGKTDVRAVLRGVLTAKAGAYAKAITVEQGTHASSIVVSGRSIPLRFYRVTRAKKSPLRVRIVKGRALKRVRGLFWNPKATAAEQNTLLQREGRAREPFRRALGPSLASYLDADKPAYAAVRERLEQRMHTQLLRRRDYLLKKFAGVI